MEKTTLEVLKQIEFSLRRAIEMIEAEQRRPVEKSISARMMESFIHQYISLAGFMISEYKRLLDLDEHNPGE